MLSPDLAARLQLESSTQLQPLSVNRQQIADKLADFSAGQRLTAQILAFLPNGTYRATIAQREITLALPFAAQSGDSLELEVVESGGKLTFALLTRKDGGEAKDGAASSATTLSRTGQLISGLLGRDSQGSAASLPLNANQPILAAPPQGANAHEIAPMLRQAITRSGMFYESHQALWIAGRLEKAALLQEPQGQLSSALASEGAEEGEAPHAPAAQRQPAPGQGQGQSAGQPAGSSQTSGAQNTAASQQLVNVKGQPLNQLADGKTAGSVAQAAQPGGQAGASAVARETVPIVQQQLESLASQQFNWQGQIWPGQGMRWEIEENGARRDGEDAPANWQTSLYLALPQLGELEARIRIAGEEIHLDLGAADEEARARLEKNLGRLRERLEAVNLTLANARVRPLADPAELTPDPVPPAEASKADDSVDSNANDATAP